MAQEHINLGTPPAGVDGDTTRVALQKCEDNFNELYPLAGAGMFKNKLINGNFDWWQRGTSFSGVTYAADRWQAAAIGSGGAYSQQTFAANQTAVPNGPAFFFRTVATSVAGAANFVNITQKIEDVRVLAGKMVTVSFWAKADAARPIGVGMTQDFGLGGSPSPQNVLAGQLLVLSTAWQKLSVTFAVPAIGANTLGTTSPGWTGVKFYFDAGGNYATASGNIGQQSGTFDIAQVQLEVGSVPTPFEMRPFGMELSLCQRYFEKSYGINTPPGTASVPGGLTIYIVGPAFSAATITGFFKVTKAGPPAITFYSPVTGSSGKARDIANNVDVDGTAIIPTVYSFGLYATLSSSGPLNVGAQFTADAEL